MDVARIARLLDPFLASSAEDHRPHGAVPAAAALSPGQLRLISKYIDLLLRWNARINLTAVRQPDEIVTRHFGESMFAARHLFPLANPERSSRVEPGPGNTTQQVHVIDVGSGAGFPGLPIKIWAPHIRLSLIESSQKKATFLREAIRTLTLTNVDVFAGRANDFHPDTLRPNFPAANVVTLRAVERFDSILSTAADLVKPSGRLAVLVGESQMDRVRELAPGFAWSNPAKLPLSTSRFLLVGARNQDD